ncbi:MULTISPECIES: TolC family protein [Mesonia]|uniref:Uncharacterized protein n=1 Tax=Mesonia oceanica TaxID=2687242 RepID=A0AC61Y9H6_9FLAO|nr:MULTISPECIES: TolC family protein [Mesonia]MAN27894.1 transporter [Mesonia sp.]MAQ41073.1 transporter [Mesonia sp.]VVV01169.1 hypothetical protein FVB9532_02450 [Mesonia oceanica]|tara:strand:+ start:4843 stop:6162 length:1320 start_codon:yes stop_codon:yes gene_type:complete
MRIKYLLILFLLVTAWSSLKAQEMQKLSIEKAVEIALNNSDEAKLADTKVRTAENQLQSTKNLQYPDLSISGQYQHLFKPDVDVKLFSNQNPDAAEGQATASPNVNQLLLGQASLSVPVFSGFKIQNTIEANENNFKAVSFDAKESKEQIALTTIQNYINLYKAQQTVELFKENLKSSQQRVKDFSAMEENGLLARNDLLKAKLQEANVRLSLEEAQKQVKILNYRLAIFLKQPRNTQFQIQENFGLPPKEIAINDGDARPELEALRYRQQASENGIKVAKSNYYPSVSLLGGYIAADIKNAITVTNAMNIGMGLSYDLSNIFKNKSEVRKAKSKAEEVEYNLKILDDQINVEIENARQEYELAQRKLDVFAESEEQAIENYRIVKDKYDNGLVDTNDLLEADLQKLQSKINLAYAKANITLMKYQLYKAEGTLTNQFK